MSRLRYYRENRETVELTLGDGMHEGKFTLETVGEDGDRRHAAKIGPADRLLAERLMAAMAEYCGRVIESTPPPTSERLNRLEAFAGELVSGAFPHLAHLVPAGNLGDAVKALKG